MAVVHSNTHYYGEDVITEIESIERRIIELRAKALTHDRWRDQGARDLYLKSLKK